MKRDTPFSMRLDSEMKAALRQMAKEEHRTLTNFVETIIVEYIAARKRIAAVGWGPRVRPREAKAK